MKIQEFSQYFDHTCLHPAMNRETLLKVANEAKQYEVHSLCIPPIYVEEATQLLMDSDVKTITVIAFPNGYNSLKTKAYETETAISHGAQEIDLVNNLCFLKNKDYTNYVKEIKLIHSICNGIPLKVILETSLLTNDEIHVASQLIAQTGAEYIKTSTGFGSRGASLEDIKIIRAAAPDQKIKASGGISTLDDALAFIEAGANRIGASQTPTIIEAFKKAF